MAIEGSFAGSEPLGLRRCWLLPNCSGPCSAFFVYFVIIAANSRSTGPQQQNTDDQNCSDDSAEWSTSADWQTADEVVGSVIVSLGSGSLFRWTLFRRTQKYLISTLTRILTLTLNHDPNPNLFWALFVGLASIGIASRYREFVYIH